MIKSIIAALDEKRGIGREDRLPWHLPTDLKRFKNMTMGHHVIMGRKTYDSIGRPLSGRINIVVTRNEDYQSEGVVVANSIDEALETAFKNGETEVFIIGGAEIYRQMLPIVDRLYLTHVHTDSASDIFFPALDQDWKVISSEEIPADNKNVYSTTFRFYART
jgi:dihydrofolate reductase